MNIADVMNEVADVVKAIGGDNPLRVHAHPIKTISPPAAVVTYPDTITYDVTAGRGSDSMSLGLWIAVGDVNTVSARDVLSDYTAGAGPRSIKAAIEGHGWTSCDFVNVTAVEFDPITLAAIQYMGAMFTLDVIGPGSGTP